MIVLVAFVFFRNSDPGIAQNFGNKKGNPDSVETKDLLPKHDTEIFVNGRKVIIKISSDAEKKGSILVLHGWNLPAGDWCTKTTLCEKAAGHGYFL